MSFHDRADAGRALAEALVAQQPDLDSSAVVLGLPRGGLPVAAEVAARLGCPLDVFCVRKLRAPEHPELAMGAVASGGVVVRNETVIARAGIGAAEFDAAVRFERAELERVERSYRGLRDAVPLAGRVAIAVDDGLATGASARAAIQALRARRPSRVVLAVPVGAADSLRVVGADAVCCVHAPRAFGAVSQYYRHFPQVSDAEVAALLRPVPGDQSAL
jgi:predicted phosphoribosyltransferase